MKHLFLLLMLSFTFGCSNEGDPIHFVVPEGFEGVIQLIVDGSDDGGYVFDDGRHVYTIPVNGVLHVRTLTPTQSWHTISAADAAGKPIYWYEPPPPNDQAYLVREFGATTFVSEGEKEVSWYAVGSPEFIERVKQWSYDRTGPIPISTTWMPLVTEPDQHD